MGNEAPVDLITTDPRDHAPTPATTRSAQGSRPTLPSLLANARTLTPSNPERSARPNVRVQGVWGWNSRAIATVKTGFIPAAMPTTATGTYWAPIIIPRLCRTTLRRPYA